MIVAAKPDDVVALTTLEDSKRVLGDLTADLPGFSI